MLLLGLPIGILAISAITYNSRLSRAQKDKVFMILSCIFVIIFVGLRSRYVGSSDTRIYVVMFESIKGQKLSGFLSNQNISARNFLFSEGSFYFLTWVFAQIFNNGQAFILITTAIMTFCVAHFINRHAENPTLSWIVYSCLGLMTFNMNGMRQGLAMSICLFAYGYAKEKKLLKFLLVVLLAFTFHATAVLFLIVYPLVNYKPTAKKNAFLGILGILFFTQSRRLAAIYDNLTGKNYAEGEAFESGGFINVAIYIIIIAILMICSIRKEEMNNDFNSFIVFLSIGFVFYISRYLTIQIFERASYYFYYFSILAIPNLEKAFDKKSRLMYELSVVCLSIFLFAYRIANGSFSDFNFL